jgi:hypothetical protein
MNLNDLCRRGNNFRARQRALLSRIAAYHIGLSY